MIHEETKRLEQLTATLKAVKHFDKAYKSCMKDAEQWHRLMPELAKWFFNRADTCERAKNRMIELYYKRLK